MRVFVRSPGRAHCQDQRPLRTSEVGRQHASKAARNVSLPQNAAGMPEGLSGIEGSGHVICTRWFGTCHAEKRTCRKQEQESRLGLNPLGIAVGVICD